MIPIWSAEERAAARQQILELSGLVQAEAEAAEEPAGASAPRPVGPVQRQVNILQGFLDRADAAAEAADSSSSTQPLNPSITERIERAAIRRRNLGLSREQAQLIPCRDTDPQPPVEEPLSEAEEESLSEYTLSEASSVTEAWDSDEFRDLPELE